VCWGTGLAGRTGSLGKREKESGETSGEEGRSAWDSIYENLERGVRKKQREVMRTGAPFGGRREGNYCSIIEKLEKHLVGKEGGKIRITHLSMGLAKCLGGLEGNHLKHRTRTAQTYPSMPREICCADHREEAQHRAKQEGGGAGRRYGSTLLRRNRGKVLTTLQPI